MSPVYCQVCKAELTLDLETDKYTCEKCLNALKNAYCQKDETKKKKKYVLLEMRLILAGICLKNQKPYLMMALKNYLMR